MYNYSAMNFTLPNTFETSNYMVDAMNYWSESNPNSDIAANRANGNGNAFIIPAGLRMLGLSVYKRNLVL